MARSLVGNLLSMPAVVGGNRSINGMTGAMVAFSDLGLLGKWLRFASAFLLRPLVPKCHWLLYKQGAQINVNAFFTVFGIMVWTSRPSRTNVPPIEIPVRFGKE